MLVFCLLCWSFGFTSKYVCFGPVVIYTKPDNDDVCCSRDWPWLKCSVLQGFVLGVDIAADGALVMLGPVALLLRWRRLA